MTGDVTAGRVPSSFGQHHAAHVGLIHPDWLHGPVFTPGVKDHITVDLWVDRGRSLVASFAVIKDCDANRVGGWVTHFCKHKAGIEGVA